MGFHTERQTPAGAIADQRRSSRLPGEARLGESAYLAEFAGGVPRWCRGRLLATGQG